MRACGPLLAHTAGPRYDAAETVADSLYMCGIVITTLARLLDDVDEASSSGGPRTRLTLRRPRSGKSSAAASATGGRLSSSKESKAAAAKLSETHFAAQLHAYLGEPKPQCRVVTISLLNVGQLISRSRK